MKQLQLLLLIKDLEWEHVNKISTIQMQNKRRSAFNSQAQKTYYAIENNHNKVAACCCTFIAYVRH